ncbi:MAG: glycosyl hydrolase, partial [Planctomycetales bacterium]
GINHFVLHVYVHQPNNGMPGKNPWFGTAFHRNTPWFRQSRDWVKYLQRCHHMLQQGNPVADVAVYIGDFAPQMTGPANPIPAGYDYDYMGSDAILRNLDVVDGKWVVFDEDDPKRIAASYKLLAMPKVKYIRPHVLKRLDALKAKGGKIVHAVPVTAQTLQSAGITPIVSDTTCTLRWKARQLDDGMMFFLSNFQKAGTFEATLRVIGKTPELFNPVTGEITKLARYQSVNTGTRVTIDIHDKSDSCFIVFRDKPSQPSVVSAQQNGKDIAPADLKLFYGAHNKLTAETGRAGDYTLNMSDGTKRTLVIEKNSQTFPVKSPWKSVKQDEKGFSVLNETTFDLPSAFGKGKRVVLDLGKVEVMAKVTLNGKSFDTLWMPPFELDVTDVIKPGKNILKVLVTSTIKGNPKLGKTVQLKTVSRKTMD